MDLAKNTYSCYLPDPQMCDFPACSLQVSNGQLSLTACAFSGIRHRPRQVTWAGFLSFCWTVCMVSLECCCIVQSLSGSSDDSCLITTVGYLRSPGVHARFALLSLGKEKKKNPFFWFCRTLAQAFIQGIQLFSEQPSVPECTEPRDDFLARKTGSSAFSWGLFAEALNRQGKMVGAS